jgi:hypothetical protein
MGGLMDAAADNLTGFTGVLVGRRYRPGQKYIQLVFKTTEGLKLSLSRNLQMVRSLSVGNTYHVEGAEYVLGKKVVIKEPTANLVQSKGSFFGRHKVLVSVMVALTITSAAGIVLISKPSSANRSETNNQSTNTQSKQPAKDTNNANKALSATSPGAENQTPAPPSSTTTVKKTASTKTNVRAASTPAAAQPVASPLSQPAPTTTTDTQQQDQAPITTQQDPTPPPAAPDPAPAPDPGTAGG